MVPEPENDATQPVEVNRTSPAQAAGESTQPVKLTSETAQTQLPDWLLRFASDSEPSHHQNEPGEASDFQIPLYEDTDEEQTFIPPTPPEAYEWLELSDFQEYEAPETQPTDQGAGIDTESVEAQPQQTSELPVTVEKPAEADETFSEELRVLFNEGKHQEALALIQKNKADPLRVEASKKTLRSRLTLSSEAYDLWDVYDDLNDSSHE